MAPPLKYTNEGVPKNWDGRDWQQYKWAMELVFKKKELADVVYEVTKRDQLTTDEGKTKFDDMQVTIMQLIGMSLPAEKLHQVRHKTTGTEMWRALCEIYECTENETTIAHRTRYLRNELEAASLAPGGDVNEHLSKMFNLRTELTSLKYTVEDIDMVEMLLDSLPSQHEFESLKAGIRYNTGVGGTSPERVRELIRVADSRQKLYRAKGGGNQRGNHKGGGNTGNSGNSGGNKAKSGKGDNQQQEKSSGFKKKQKKCFICESTEHLVADCPQKVKPAADTEEQKRKPKGHMTIFRSNQAAIRPDSVEAMAGVVAGTLGELPETPQMPVEILDVDLDDLNVDHEVYGASDEHVGSEVAGDWWYFDTASNTHLTGNRDDYCVFTEDTSESQSVHGVTPALASRIAGVGTVILETEVDGERIELQLEDVFYVPGAAAGLLSPGLAMEQGFEFDYDRETKAFKLEREGRTVAEAKPHDATWGFQVHPTSDRFDIAPSNRLQANFTAAEGVASLRLWHERLGHICPQYVKTMADKDLVKGMMLTQRQVQDDCEACHIGKQKKTPHRKKLDRGLQAPNQVVYADLLIPSKENGTRFEAVLVIMDGFSRFVTVHMLTSKSSEVINKHIKEYILWAERQAGRNSPKASIVKHKVRQVLMTHSVRQVLTDKGGEFVNLQMKEWYKSQGIEHVLVGPKSSQLNLCERTHQSLVEMTKATMRDAGFPRSLWPEALRNAVYLKNRVYNKGTQGIPFQMMFGVKPDIHHIRKFGALAYVHVPVTPGRRKHQDNAKVGFVLGYAEDVVGCKVYFPEERTAKFVADLRVTEDVMYRDRHAISVDDSDLDSLHFEQASVDDLAVEKSDSSAMTETLCLEGGESGAEGNEPQDQVDLTKQHMAAFQPEDVSAVPSVEGVTVAIPSGPCTVAEATWIGDGKEACTELENADDKNADVSGLSRKSRSQLTATVVSGQDVKSDSEQITSLMRSEDMDNETVVGTCGSTAGSEVREDDEENGDADSIASDGDEADVNMTVASVCGTPHDDDGDLLTDDDTHEDEAGEPNIEPVERVDVSALLPQQQTGKRTHRSETSSAALRVELSADKQQPKRKRTGLREAHERRRPNYLNDYVANVVQSTSRILDRNGRPIRASNVRIPRNHREAMRSEFRDLWREAELEEMAALRAKG